MLASRVRTDWPDLGRDHRELVGSALQLGFLLGVAAALPGDEDTAFTEQGGRELREGAEPADGAGGDGLVGLRALPGRPGPARA